MGVELLSSKIITPYYGASLYVWTAVLGFTLGGLALGYFLGGYISERFDPEKSLMLLILTSAVLVLLMPFISAWILDLTLPLEIRLGISISCIVFLLPVILCFGTVSPIIIRLVSDKLETVGFSAGRIYAISTTGGILFTFLVGFFLISAIGIGKSVLMIGAFLCTPLAWYALARFRNGRSATRSTRAVAVLLAVASLSAGCKSEVPAGEHRVSGMIRNYKKADYRLMEITPMQNYFISNIIPADDGSFTFNIKANTRSLYALVKNSANYIYFINDVPEINIETDFDEFENYVVTGSPNSEEILQLITTHKKLKSEVMLAEQVLKQDIGKKSGLNPGDDETQKLENRVDIATLKLKGHFRDYISGQDDELMGISATTFFTAHEDYAFLEDYYNNLSGTDYSQKQKQDFRRVLDDAKKRFPSFYNLSYLGVIDANLKPTKVPEVSGKVVFFNVWAPWCYYSRIQQPYLNKAYNKFKDNDSIMFINYAISKDVTRWKAMLDSTGATSYELCDTLELHSVLLRTASIDYIPSNYLVDKKGNVVSMNMRDDEMVKEIEKLLNRK